METKFRIRKNLSKDKKLKPMIKKLETETNGNQNES